MAGKKGGFTRGELIGWGVGWNGVEETLGPANWLWADLLWKELKWRRSWESGGVEGEASLLKLWCKSAVSGSTWFMSLWDLVLKMFLLWCNSKCDSSKTVRFSGVDFVLRRFLSAANFPDLEVCHKILSGLSTTRGGLGSGWDPVLTLCEARLLFQN